MSDSAIPWIVACPTPLSMEFPRQEYWSGLSFPSPGDLPDPRIKPRSPALQAGSLPTEPPGKPLCIYTHYAFPSFLFSAICKASSDNHFAFWHFFILGMVLQPVSCTMSRTSVHSFLGTLSIRSNLLNIFVTSTV